MEGQRDKLFFSYWAKSENWWGKGGRDKGGRWGLCGGVREKNLLNNRWIGEVEEERGRRARENPTTCCPPLSPLSLNTQINFPFSLSPFSARAHIYKLSLPSVSISLTGILRMKTRCPPSFRLRFIFFIFLRPQMIKSAKYSNFNNCRWRTRDWSVPASLRLHLRRHSYLRLFESIF